jgi:hypothetical protein
LEAGEAYRRTKEEVERRPMDFEAGDVVVAEFLGDSQLVVVRSDREAGDFGRVLIALPIDPRSEWRVVSDSILDFIARVAESPEYWWPH